MCDHQIAGGRNYIKEGIFWCHYCGAVTHKNAKTLETNFYFPSKEENEEDEDKLISIRLKLLCIHDCFCHWFLIKFLKRYLLSCQFICRVL